MALTTLQIYLEPPESRESVLPHDGVIEYTRNERGRNIIKAYVVPTPNDGTLVGEEITLRLMKARRDRSEEVVQARKVFTFTSAVPPNGMLFEFDLKEIKYSSKYPFPVVRRGDYFIEVEHSGGITGPSAISASTVDFRVTLMTTDFLELNWLKGATRKANDERNVRFQPREITGVKVIELSTNHPMNIFPMSLEIGAEGNRYLNWGNRNGPGEIIKINMAIPDGIQQQYILPANDDKNYAVVEVNPLLLPNVNTTERLWVDKSLIKREVLRRWIDEEAEWLESTWLHTPLDPALVVSDFNLGGLNIGPGASTSQAADILPENKDWDLKGTPTTYYPPTAGHWINLKVPYWNPIRFEYLIGALENTRIVDINVDWVHKGASGYITLIPFNQSIAYHFIGLMYVNALRGAVSLPSFWRYRYWAGFEGEETPPDVLEVIGLRAAANGLGILGQMYKGGIASTSISGGGRSTSTSFTASATFGIYSATIEGYNKKLMTLEKQIQRKYFGITFEIL